VIGIHGAGQVHLCSRAALIQNIALAAGLSPARRCGVRNSGKPYEKFRVAREIFMWSAVPSGVKRLLMLKVRTMSSP
jgi:hypothetical protein